MGTEEKRQPLHERGVKRREKSRRVPNVVTGFKGEGKSTDGGECDELSTLTVKWPC